MFTTQIGGMVHFYTDAPEDGGQYVGSVLLYRLGVNWTPFDYDFDVMGGALGTYLLSRKIPSGARVIGGFYEVETTPTSATDAGTMSLGINAAADLMAATAISTGTTWDAASPVLLPAGTKDPVTLTADRQVQAVIAAEVWTAGKIHGALAWTFEKARAKSFTAA